MGKVGNGKRWGIDEVGSTGCGEYGRWGVKGWEVGEVGSGVGGSKGGGEGRHVEGKSGEVGRWLGVVGG